MSEYSKMESGLRIKTGGPRMTRPTKEDMNRFKKEANDLILKNRKEQKEYFSVRGSLGLEGKHFIVAGGTGNGLGSTMVFGILGMIRESGSLMMISRDLERSVGYMMGKLLMEEEDLGGRFQWSNEGLELGGKGLAVILKHLKDVGAKSVIYINTAAAAISGILSGRQKIYVKDIDEEGLFQWELKELSDREVEQTKTIMGSMAVGFRDVLESEGIRVEASVFADWRGSLDKLGRDENVKEYGRNGSYSGSLYLPKEIIQEATLNNYRRNRNRKDKMIDIFYPVMKTRALGYIPGGMMMAKLMDYLMGGVIGVNRLGFQGLECIGRLISGVDENPFPRLDLKELECEQWYYEVIKQLNNREEDEFYYQKWILSFKENIREDMS